MSEQNVSLQKPVSSAALRMRLLRERRADGLRCIKFLIYDNQIDALVAQQLLPQDKRNDPEEIAKGLYAIIDRVLPPPL